MWNSSSPISRQKQDKVKDIGKQRFEESDSCTDKPDKKR